MCTLASFRPAMLHPSIRQNEAVIRYVIHLTGAIDLKPSLLVILIYVPLSTWQLFRTDERCVMNHDSGGDYRIHERLKRGFIFSSRSPAGRAQGTFACTKAPRCSACSKHSRI